MRDEVKNYRIPFGKIHKGKTLEQTPLLYLDWLVGQEWLYGKTKEMVREYLEDDVIVRALDSELESSGD
jgi:uncharacterized protein (DUF3820 family)